MKPRENSKSNLYSNGVLPSGKGIGSRLINVLKWLLWLLLLASIVGAIPGMVYYNTHISQEEEYLGDVIYSSARIRILDTRILSGLMTLEKQRREGKSSAMDLDDLAAAADRTTRLSYALLNGGQATSVTGRTVPVRPALTPRGRQAAMEYQASWLPLKARIDELVRHGDPLPPAALAETLQLAQETAPQMDEISEMLASEETHWLRQRIGRLNKERTLLITYLTAASIMLIPAIFFLSRTRRFHMILQEMVRRRTAQWEEANQRLQREVAERRRVEQELARRERKFRMLAENWPDFLVRFDALGRFTYVNPAVTRFSGLPVEEFVGRTIRERPFQGLPGHSERLEAALFQALDERRENAVEVALPTPRGLRVLEARNVPELDENGDVQGVLGVTRDITEQKKYLEALRENLELQGRLSRIANLAPVAVYEFRLAPDGRMSLPYASLGMKDIFGVEPEELAVDFTRSWERNHPEDLPQLQEAIHESARTLKPFHCEWRVRHPQKGEIWVDARALPRRLPDGSIVWHGYFHDVTERKRAERKLRNSEARYRALYRYNPSMIFTLCQEGKVLSVNEATVNQLGYSAEELEGESILKVFHPDDRVAVSDQLKSCLEEPHHVHHWQFRKVRKDGRLMWVEDNAQGVKDLGGMLTVLLVCQDITERKQTEEKIFALNEGLEQRVRERTRELAESEARFRMIYDSAPVSIWQEDWSGVLAAIEELRRDGVTNFPTYFHEHPEFVARMFQAVKVLDVNDWTLGMFGAADKEQVMRSLGPILGGRDAMAGFVAALTALAAEQREFRTETNLATMRGDTLRALVAISFPPRGSGSGNVIATVLDITLRQRAEKQIQHLNEQLEARARALEEANKELESFSYSVSHDLRAPLRSINGFSRILLEDNASQLDAQGKENLEMVVTASQRMGQLIDDLLHLSRVTRSEMRRLPVDLSALARNVAEELAKTDPARPARFEIEPGLVARADAHLMRIVLDNLLGNAWKFTSHRPDARIEFRRLPEGAGDGETPAYFVRDNGAGFDMAYADKLFGAFQRLHSAEEFPGSGIGLATVKRIINRHGGRVWAESQPGQGATFYFTLPNGNGAGR